jgi:phytoene/squalene synthetase
MTNAKHYEEHILRELRALPTEALPKVLRLIRLVREEFLTQQGHEAQQKFSEEVSHEQTRHLLTISKTNWTQELIAEREDRLRDERLLVEGC